MHNSIYMLTVNHINMYYVLLLLIALTLSETNQIVILDLDSVSTESLLVRKTQFQKYLNNKGFPL